MTRSGASAIQPDAPLRGIPGRDTSGVRMKGFGQVDVVSSEVAEAGIDSPAQPLFNTSAQFDYPLAGM